MNILEIPSWYATNDNPIKGSFFREHALMLKKSGNSVAVIFVELHEIKDKIKNKINYFNDDGIRTIYIHIHSYGYAKNALLFSLIIRKYYYDAFKLLLNEGFVPDVIQAHSFLPAGIAGCYIRNKNNIPVVVTEHSSKVHTNKLDVLERLVLRKVVKESDAFVCVSMSLKEAVCSYIDGKDIKVIPNNLSDLFKYYHNKNSEPFEFACIGNLIDSKRQSLLINCFYHAFKNSDEKLFLVGDGVNYQDLKNQIDKLDLSERVFLTGRLGREEVATLLNEVNVFALVSTNETFGVSYIEAMACGCPVIATFNGGADDIVDGSNGIIVDVDDIDAITNALIDIRNNYNSFDKEMISKAVILSYGNNTINNKYIDIYKSVM